MVGHCPNLTTCKRSIAGGTMGIYARENIASLVLVEKLRPWRSRAGG